MSQSQPHRRSQGEGGRAGRSNTKTSCPRRHASRAPPASRCGRSAPLSSSRPPGRAGHEPSRSCRQPSRSCQQPARTAAEPIRRARRPSRIAKSFGFPAARSRRARSALSRVAGAGRASLQIGPNLRPGAPVRRPGRVKTRPGTFAAPAARFAPRPGSASEGRKASIGRRLRIDEDERRGECLEARHAACMVQRMETDGVNARRPRRW
jgi:hypothetical protein